MAYLNASRLVGIGVIVSRLARAQGETTSAIAGSVSDQTGAAVSGAAVIMAGTGNGLKRAANTDHSGRFTFQQIKPGSYSVEVIAPGFEPQRKPSVAAGLGQR